MCVDFFKTRKWFKLPKNEQIEPSDVLSFRIAYLEFFGRFWSLMDENRTLLPYLDGIFSINNLLLRIQVKNIPYGTEANSSMSAKPGLIKPKSILNKPIPSSITMNWGYQIDISKTELTSPTTVPPPPSSFDWKQPLKQLVVYYSRYLINPKNLSIDKLTIPITIEKGIQI